MTVSVAAPAKVNLVLRVGPRRPSGYHDIHTLFCGLELADEVEVHAGDESGIALEVDGPDLGDPDRNLAHRAAAAFFEVSGVRPQVRIRLRKRIPAGGGLGGGSSDAAATLLALDRLHPGVLAPADRDTIAAGLGSDVPFFLSETPLAWGEGRGERLTPLRPPEPRPVLLVLPPFPVGTADAYAWLDRDRDRDRHREGEGEGERGPNGGAGPSDHAAAVPAPGAGERVGWPRIEAGATNDFEQVVYSRHPELGEVREALRAGGAAIALLSGSGSTVFGVFPDDGSAAAAAISLRRSHPTFSAVLTRTRRAWPR